MPLYSYVCDECSYADELLRSIKDSPSWWLTCPKCGKKTFRRDLIADSPQAQCFEPYVEENFNGVPIEVTGPKQRDQLCEEHGCTYDSKSPSQKISMGEPDVVTDEDIKDVIEQTKGGKILPDDVREACKEAKTDDSMEELCPTDQ